MSLSRLDDALRRHRAGELDAAEALYRAAIEAAPDDVRPVHNLGVLLLRSGRPAEAVELLARAVELDRTRPQNWQNYVEALVAAGQAPTALATIARLRSSGMDGPALDALETHASLTAGLERIRAGADLEAEAYFRTAVARGPLNAAAFASLGAVLVRLGRDAEAETFLRKALEITPDDGAVLQNLGRLLRDAGRADEARAAYAKAAVRSDSIDLNIQARLTVTPIAGSFADIAAQRAAYAAGLAGLAADPRSFRYGGEAAYLPWYNLAYHGLDDRDLISRTGAVLAEKVAGLRHTSPQLSSWRGPAGRRIRVVFLSSLFRDHTIGRLYLGLISQLDRRRFEVVVAHGPAAQHDAVRDAIDRAADQTLALDGDLSRQRETLEAVAPDVLFYPDIGMTADTYFLAHSRLAPVQATAWGHPNTSGIPEMDYFISTGRFEPADGDAHYSERLVRLRRIPCFLAPPEAAPVLDRAQLGLPEGRLYGCPQTLFKLHPDFDAVLDAIAAQDPDGRIVIPAADRDSWTAVIQARWRARHPRLLDQVLWLPRAPREQFLAQLAHFDLLLDPLHFGSGHTFYLSVAQGLPTVTSPGQFARGRVVAGAYGQMGAGADLVASDPADYVARAVALGRDPDRRRALRTELAAAARDKLFSDQLALAEFGAFLEAAVEAAGRGERLAAGWTP